MQLTGYIVAMCMCIYPHNITDILPLHVAHLLLLSSLFTVGLAYVVLSGKLQVKIQVAKTTKNWVATHNPSTQSRSMM